MTDPLDEFTRQLQDQIFAETKENYGPIVYERWCHPMYMGRMDDPDGYGCITGTCGDTMQIFLKFEGDRIRQASFVTDGCGTSAVCGSFAAELALGKNPDDILGVTGEKILKFIGGLPEADRHCAFLAAETLQAALDDYMQNQRAGPARRVTPEGNKAGLAGKDL